MRPHKKLIAWKESIMLVKNVYIETSSFPDVEKFGIISQIRRAAVSVSSNIAEGAARSSKIEFRKFLFYSSGSSSEIDTLLVLSSELGFLNNKQFEKLQAMNDKVAALLNGLIKSINLTTTKKNHLITSSPHHLIT